MLIVLSIMVVIFLFSSQNVETSDSFSKEVTRKLLPLIDRIVSLFPQGTFQTATDNGAVGNFFEDLNHYVRKTAHVTEYAILGAAIMRFAVALLKAYEKKLTIWAGVLSFAVGVLYASSDEFHQLFVDGRGGRFKDVVIDSVGVAIGCILVYIIYVMSTKRKKRKADENQDGRGPEG